MIRSGSRGAGLGGDVHGHRRHTFSTSGLPSRPEGRNTSVTTRIAEGGDILVVDREVGRPQGLDEADQQSAQDGAGERADAAQHGGCEGLDPRHEAIVEVHDAVVDHEHEAGDGRQRRSHHERERDGAVDVDAQERGHAAVLLAGALGPPERGLLHHVPEGRQQHRGHHDDQDLLVGERDGIAVDAAAEHDHVAQDRRHRLVARALRDLHQVRQEDRHADGGDQRRQPEGAAQGPVGEPLDRPGPQRGQQHADDEDDEQGDGQRADAENLRQRHEKD